MRTALTIAVTSGLFSCQLVYDFGEFEPPEIDIEDLSLEAPVPSSVLEGSGCLLDDIGGECVASSPGALVVVPGENISPDAVVTLDGFAFSNHSVAAQVSTSGRFLGFVVPFPVDGELPRGDSETVSITVAQGDGVSQTVDLSVEGLDEFTVSGFVGDADTLAGSHRFSTVHIDEALVFTDAQAVYLAATAHVQVDFSVTSNDAGCAGGSATVAGACATGGAAGIGGGGGGGGGNKDVGMAGDSNPDSGGIATLATMLSPLEDAAGGGGGGAGAVGDGRSGGAGGGAVAFSSRGRLVLGASFSFSATGEDGTDLGVGTCNLNGGGGGGGAGGSLLLRGERGLEAGTPTIVLTAGEGGDGGGDASCAGGAGSEGLLRVDGPSVPAGLSGGVQGPILVEPMLITGEGPDHEITVAASVGPTFYMTINEGAPEPFTLANSPDSISIPLEVGHNSVCLLVNEDGNRGVPESITCQDFAYLP